MNIKLIKGDCLEAIKEIPYGSIDAIITDPPYGIDYVKWDILNNKYIKQCHKILKDNGSMWIFAGWSNVLTTKKELDKYFIFKNWVIWDRIKGRGAKYNLVSTREDILWYSKSNIYTFNKQSSKIKKKTMGMGKKNKDEFRKLSNVWTDISSLVPWSKERVKHPTQKPVELFERIIKISSNKGDVIFDPFMGSGTTGVACKNLNRNFIGVELDESYFKIAEERIKNTPEKLL